MSYSVYVQHNNIDKMSHHATKNGVMGHINYDKTQYKKLDGLQSKKQQMSRQVNMKLSCSKENKL